MVKSCRSSSGILKTDSRSCWTAIDSSSSFCNKDVPRFLRITNHDCRVWYADQSPQCSFFRSSGYRAQAFPLSGLFWRCRQLGHGAHLPLRPVDDLSVRLMRFLLLPIHAVLLLLMWLLVFLFLLFLLRLLLLMFLFLLLKILLSLVLLLQLSRMTLSFKPMLESESFSFWILNLRRVLLRGLRIKWGLLLFELSRTLGSLLRSSITRFLVI